MTLRKRVCFTACICGAALLYTGSFMGFRLTAIPLDVPYPDDPYKYIVMFSHNSTMHGFLKTAYAPMIRLFPGECYYPSQEEHTKLMTTFGRQIADPDEQ